MAEFNSQIIQRRDIYEEEELLESKAIKPAALLLTPAPMESLRDEFGPISDLGPHFYAINFGIRIKLKNDPHADKLRATLLKFCLPMYSASEDICDAIAVARGFYVHGWDEMLREGPPEITKEKASRLLEADFQSKAIIRAHEIVKLAARAARTVREEALPVLPQLKEDLDEYVDDYITRAALNEERQNSWVPTILQDAVWGPVDPTPWTVTAVTELPQHLLEGGRLLHRLPPFLDHLEIHFRRLSEITSQQVLELGYTTSDDLSRLYQDRLLCDYILSHMTNSWYSAGRAFGIWGSDEIPTLHRTQAS